MFKFYRSPGSALQDQLAGGKTEQRFHFQRLARRSVAVQAGWRHLSVRDPALSDYRCRGPHSLLTVLSDGGVRDCRRRSRSLADVTRLRAEGRPLGSVFDLARRRELLREAETCTVCNNPDVIELSWLWELRPAMLRKVLELATT